MRLVRCVAVWAGVMLSLSGCSSGGVGGNTTPPVATYVLTVVSTNPVNGVAIGVAPADNNGAANGTSTFTRTYNAGTAVTLTSPVTSGGAAFAAWTGCTSANGPTCSVTMNANTTVTANFAAQGVTSVTVTPNPATATIGRTMQFAAMVAGTGSFSSAVTWSVVAPAGSSLSAGTIDANGFYTTPYPAPATVTVTATSAQDTSKSGSVTVTLQAPAAAAGPALTVDAGDQTHAISPFIYGMNAYVLDTATATDVNVAVVRWGGDGTSRYNYLLNATSSASDWYFENQSGATFTWPTGNFNDLVTSADSIGAATLATVPVLGWVAKDATSCSFPVAKYPNQYKVDAARNCGDGEDLNQKPIAGNDPTTTSVAEGPAWVGQWVSSLVSQFGKAANGGVAMYALDNEPSWWDAVHRDVHPLPFTYDEVTQNGMATAAAIKTADPTAQVTGPVMDYWWNYFYSKKDVESGWGAGPCYQPWSNPVDRDAHGGVPMIEYYLQQFAKYDATNHERLLDYLDLHTYFAPQYKGVSVGFAAAGDTGEQQARLNGTRVFWDATYTDPSLPQPNYKTDANYTSSCTPPLQASQVVPMMKGWVAKDYPGTKTAISEYNFGGMESINGALAEADILGIFGREGLDMATLWPTTNYAKQTPGTVAFEIYRNYDGNKSTFGNMALASTSADQGKLSVYGALRTSDGSLTIVVINKTYGDLTAVLSLDHFTPGGQAKTYRYSDANLAGIVPEPDTMVSPPESGSTTSTMTATFPAQSITLFVVP